MKTELPRSRKAQTTMVLLVMVVIIFGGLFLFLLSFASTLAPPAEYENLYTHNILLNMLRTDTGYLEDDCKTISDLFMCTFTTDMVCGNSGRTCSDILSELVPYYLGRFEEYRPGRAYLFVAESGSPNWRPLGTDGKPMRIAVGNESLEKARIEKISANQRIQKGSYILNVRVITSKK